MSSSSDELAQLRAELDAIDRGLLEAAARRLEVVRHIGRVKAGSTRAVFDRGRERAVFDRARGYAREAGLDPDIGERLIHTLVEAGHDLQEETVRGADTSGPGLQVLIIGGLGAMGRLFGDALAGLGHRVDRYDRDDPRPLDPLVPGADLVMIAVPMRLAVDTARRVAPLVREDALLCDLNSLKQAVCEVYAASCRGEAIGFHPMFGPTVASLRRQKIVACPVRQGPVSERLLADLGRLGLERVDTDPATHDRMMAVVQVLVHFRTVVMGDALRRTGVPIAESLRFTSPIYRLELAVVGRIFTQDPDLYASIEMENPYGAEVRDHFVSAAERLRDVIEAGDRDAFREVFESVGSYFDEFGVEAMRLSDMIIDTLVSRP